MKELAKHFIAELYNCDPTLLDTVSLIETVLLEAADAAKVTVVGHSFHKYAPQGVSGVVLIAESHISIHTWPEYGYAAIDIFTCGDLADNDAAIEVIRKGLKAGRVIPMEIKRGYPDLPEDQVQYKPQNN